MKWAIAKKTEKERNARGDPMDCNSAAEDKEWKLFAEDDWQWQQQQWPDDARTDDGGEEDMEDAEAADYINYNKGGKGMKGGKGFKGFGG